MYFNSNEGLKPLALNDAVLLEALDWANGELTCCRLGHPHGMPCDRESLMLSTATAAATPVTRSSAPSSWSSPERAFPTAGSGRRHT